MTQSIGPREIMIRVHEFVKMCSWVDEVKLFLFLINVKDDNIRKRFYWQLLMSMSYIILHLPGLKIVRKELEYIFSIFFDITCQFFADSFYILVEN